MIRLIPATAQLHLGCWAITSASRAVRAVRTPSRWRVATSWTTPQPLQYPSMRKGSGVRRLPRPRRRLRYRQRPATSSHFVNVDLAAEKPYASPQPTTCGSAAVATEMSKPHPCVANVVAAPSPTAHSGRIGSIATQSTSTWHRWSARRWDEGCAASPRQTSADGLRIGKAARADRAVCTTILIICTGQTRRATRSCPRYRPRHRYPYRLHRLHLIHRPRPRRRLCPLLLKVPPQFFFVFHNLLIPAVRAQVAAPRCCAPETFRYHSCALTKFKENEKLAPWKW